LVFTYFLFSHFFTAHGYFLQFLAKRYRKQIIMTNDDMGDDASLVSESEEGSKAWGNQRTAAKDTERQTLGRNETKAVGYLKIIVIIVLLTAAALVSVSTFLFTRKAEVQDFETQFEAHATRVIESFREVFDRQLAAVDALSSSMTSYALASGSTFPNVTVPYFEVLGANARILSDALIVFYMPIVSKKDRTGFEAYARDMDLQFDEALASENEMRERQDEAFGLSGRRVQELPTLRPEIYKYGPNNTQPSLPEDAAGPFLPIWQITPVFSLFKASLMLDLTEHDAVVDHLNEAIRTEQAVLNQIHSNYDPEDFDDTANTLFKLFLQLGQYRAEAATYDGDPDSNMAYPVFSDFGEERELVGILMTTLYWKVYFTDVLPPGADGIYVVLESDAKAENQTITYRIDGPSVTYLGGGDHHDTSFDHLEEYQDITEFIRDRASVRTRSYTAAELNDEYIHYTLRVYPSTDLQDDYVTSKPIVYTVVVASVFLFSSLVFLAYDCLVERRQTVVMDKAIKASAVVSSLFPEAVRDRIYNQHDEKKKETAGWRAADNKGKSLMTNGEEASGGKKGRPIADKFDNTTILFADIAGFTKWSSARLPQEVFELLEALYGAFDKIAQRRGVFKVETIGDCYLAVTGLPEPQPDHAIRMAKFARDCLIKMKQLTKDLEESLGKDTSDLSFRVGMHSGSVTAGVLRGDKGRFQLFGDTVNTAARMESNGVIGRIHCSQETADELVVAGKNKWLTPREGGIEAKGKGRLQTYFVDLTVEKSVVTSLSASDEGTNAEDKSEAGAKDSFED
jgi:class 3 adenylate cyclase